MAHDSRVPNLADHGPKAGSLRLGKERDGLGVEKRRQCIEGARVAMQSRGFDDQRWLAGFGQGRRDAVVVGGVGRPQPSRDRVVSRSPLGSR